MARDSSRTRTKGRRARLRRSRQLDEEPVAEERTPEDAEPEEEPGRFARLGAGWKFVSGAIATIATAVGVLATFGLVGGGGGPSPAVAVAAAASKATDAGSSEIRVTVVETPANAATGTGGTILGAGEFDYRRGRGRMEYDLSRHEALRDLYSVEVRFNGPAFFVRDPGGPVGFHLPKGKDWLLVEFAELSYTAARFEAVGDLQLNDPTQVLTRLREKTSGARLIGEESYYGVATQHYRAERDPDGSGPTRPTPIDVWVDEKGYLRKLETRSRTASGSTLIRTELDEFGVEVDAELPPRSRVYDYARGE